MRNNGKAIIKKSYSELSIIIPSKKNWFALLFGTAWLGGWFLGLVAVSGFLLFPETEGSGADIFILFWLMTWTIGGLAVITILSWGYFGKEIFIIGRNEILFQRTVFGVGQKYRLELKDVKNIRTNFNSYDWFGGRSWNFWGIGSGKIKFDYGFKTYSFGLALDEAEANYIATIISNQIEGRNIQLISQ